VPNISGAIYKTILNKRFIKRHLVKEMMFWISLLLALITSIIIPPRIESIDWRVIAELLSLMIVVQALKEYRVLEKIATISLSNLRSSRSIGSVIVVLTAFMGALITNDVALIALVPLTMIIAEKAKFDPMWIVIIQSQAANLGSALTPIGNPQNLFLFEEYKIGILEFSRLMFPFVVFGICWTLVMNLLNSKRKIAFDVPSSEIREPQKLGIFIGCFLVVMLSVFRIIDFRVGLVLTVVVTIILERRFFQKIDYFLLGTFLLFFVFIDNISRMDIIATLMKSATNGEIRTMTSSALISQFISNVPTAILFSSFTESYKGLLLGVNIGGSGTIIASLANLIAYRIYVKERGQNLKYLTIFMASSAITLLLSIVFGYMQLRVQGF